MYLKLVKYIFSVEKQLLAKDKENYAIKTP